MPDVMLILSSSDAYSSYMIKFVALAFSGLFAMCSCVSLNAQSSSGPLASQGEGVKLDQLIGFLPADTETITVARGPFALAAEPATQNENVERATSNRELAQHFESLPLALFQFKDGLLARNVKDREIAFALEGSRHFRAPADLGEMPFEGCSIAVFTKELGSLGSSFIRESSKTALRNETIENQQVVVFEEKLERDIWRTFVAFPHPHVILVATNREYIAEVLRRMGGKSGARALPGDLPEWKYVNSNARFWAVRHFDRSQATQDPSSPFGGKKSANFPDEKAIGLTFVLDIDKGKLATITYISGNRSAVQEMDASPLTMAHAPEGRGLDFKYKELVPGIVEGRYSLERAGPEQFFLFILEGLLGHAIYL